MGSIFKKRLQHKVPSGASRHSLADGTTEIRWTNRKRRKCKGRLVFVGGAERVAYKSHTFWIRYRDHQRRQRSEDTGSTDREHASRMLSDRQAKASSPEDAAHQAKLNTLKQAAVDDLIENYLATRSTQSRPAIRSYLSRLSRHLKWKHFSCIKKSDIEGVRDQLLTEHGQNAESGCKLLGKPQVPTLRNIRGFVIAARGFCTWVAKEYGAANALSDINAPKPLRAERRPRRAISIDDFHELIAAAERDKRDLHGCSTKGMLGKQAVLIYSLMMLTAIRPASIKKLRIRDIGFKDGRPTAMDVSPKVKGRQQQRIELPEELGDLLGEWIAIRRKDDSVDESSKVVLWPARARDHFGQHLEGAGICKVVGNYHLDMYALRGSWNTHAARSGIKPKVRAAVMGHADSKLVESVYLLEEEIGPDEAVSAVADLIKLPRHARGQADAA
jgi:integrase